MKKKIIIIVIIIVVIIIGTILIINGNKKDNNKTISQNTQTTESGNNSATNKGNNDKTQSKETAKVETKYEGVVENGVYVIEKCITSEENLVVPDKINGAPVGKIKANAFYNLKCKKITIPDSVTYIGENAFFSCANLEHIELGKGLKSVGKFAFADCPKLKRIEFWEGLETIEDPLFVDNDELEDVIIPASVVNLPKRIASTTTCPKIVIVTPAGSKAEAVAKGQGLPVRNK